MKKVYVLIRVAKEISGEVVFATTEKVFSSKESAELSLKESQQFWEEEIQGFTCYCERAVHETNLYE